MADDISSDIDFDQEAYTTICKAIYIIFILLILFTNALLIYKNARKLDFYTRPKNQIIISLAVGDIFFALFPLAVFAKNLFGDSIPEYTNPSILTMTSGASHLLVHFVYGLGICVLGIELIFRNKIHNVTNSKASKIVVSLALSSFPWLLGLIVVLPLSLANWDPTTSEFAQTFSQRKASVVISVLLPACAAVIMCIVINCCVFTSTRYHQQTVTSPPMAIVSTSTSSSQMQSGNGHTAPQPYEYYPPQQPIPGQYPLEQYPQQMENPQVNQPYAAKQPCPAGQPLILVQPYTLGEKNKGAGMQKLTGNNSPNVYREKLTLLAIAIVFFLLVVPQAIFELSYTLNKDRTDLNMVARVAISTFVTWIMDIRSFVTPLIMYFYSDNT